MLHKNSIVVCEDLSRVYHQGGVELYALRKVDLTVSKGAFMSICGPSGSGKTTLLNLIGGLDEPTEGSIQVDGKMVSEMSSSQRANMRLKHLGFIFQAYNLVPVLSALENVEFIMQLQGVPAKEREEKSRAILREVGLEGLEKRRPGELSGGQQQRVAVARAIVSSPSLVLADEPTANLDSKTAESLLQLMERMNQERQVTFLFSTHDQLVKDFAKRIVSLRDGEIVSDEQR